MSWSGVRQQYRATLLAAGVSFFGCASVGQPVSSRRAPPSATDDRPASEARTNPAAPILFTPDRAAATRADLGSEAADTWGASLGDPGGLAPLENAGACLEPTSIFDAGSSSYIEIARRALAWDQPGTIAGMMAGPTRRPPWTISLHRRAGGRYVLRVSRLDEDAWSAMNALVWERAAAKVDRKHQGETPAGVRLIAKTSERAVDDDTARILAAVWRGLLSRTQPVPTDSFVLHGQEYIFWERASAGTTISPRYGSVLERVTYVAEWLARFVEDPRPDDLADIAYVRDEMREVLLRTRDREPCSRIRRG